MSDKLLVIISTGEAAKARAGAMYAVNALKHAWLDDVKLYFFGPAEALLLEDVPLQQYVQEYRKLEGTPRACKFLADRVQPDDEDLDIGISDNIAALGVDVEYVGKPMADLIKQGYVPMVW
ncbi:MAG: hypothetical protein P8009_03055 [Gammaproteobacteria bacterium]|nr:hypothetical protein [Gammaproteobacteria bacterium]